MAIFKRILCPIDFSEHSLKALAVAEQLASLCKADIIALFVIPLAPAEPDLDSQGATQSATLAEEQVTVAQSQLHKVIAERLPHSQPFRCRIRIGDAAEQIIALAETEADLIVISTHGRTGWRHLVFGSVTEKVVRAASCPVLIVRAWPTTLETECPKFCGLSVKELQ